MGRVPAFSMRPDDCRTVLTGGNGSFPFMHCQQLSFGCGQHRVRPLFVGHHPGNHQAPIIALTANTALSGSSELSAVSI